MVRSAGCCPGRKWRRAAARALRAAIAVPAAALVLSGLAAAAEPAIEAGAKGRATFPEFERLTTITTPEVSVTGFYVLFRLTRTICSEVATVEDDLAAIAPVGFAVARGDVHSLGFEAPGLKGSLWAISVTGDSEKDEAGGHPYWVVRYGDDGRAEDCSMTWAPDPGGIDADERHHIVVWLHAGAPQLFGAIMTEPRFAALSWPLEPNYMELTRACPAGWCPMTVIPLMQADDWLIKVDLSLRPVAR